MTGAGEEPPKCAIEIIPIHFDVPAHQIPLSTFIRTAEQTEAVIRSFNRQLFDGKLRYELFVLPPEEGTFLSRLGLVVLAGWGTVWSFTESDIGKAFIKGLTTHEPAYWAEMAGTSLRQQIVNPAQGAEMGRSTDEQAIKCKYEAVIVAAATKSFLQKDVAELEAVGVAPRKFRDA